MEDKDKIIEMQRSKIAKQSSIISAQEQEIKLLKYEIEQLNKHKNEVFI